jgi:hypothetical protein
MTKSDTKWTRVAGAQRRTDVGRLTPAALIRGCQIDGIGWYGPRFVHRASVMHLTRGLSRKVSSSVVSWKHPLSIRCAKPAQLRHPTHRLSEAQGPGISN